MKFDLYLLLIFIDKGMTAVQILWQYLSKIGGQGIFHYSGFPEHRSSRHIRSRLFLELMHHRGHAVKGYQSESVC